MDRSAAVRLSRRRALVRFAAVVALPLLSACGTSGASPVSTAPPVPASLWLAKQALATPTPARQSPTPVLPLQTTVPPRVLGRPMYQMDAQHTGRSPNRGPREARVLSTFDTSKYPVRDGTTAKPDMQSSAAIGPDGSIYIGNHQGVLFALQDSSSAAGHGQSLELSWRFHPPEGSSWHATPALSPDGTVYLGFSRPGSRSDIEGTLYALRAPSGGAEADIVCGRSVELRLRSPRMAPCMSAQTTATFTPLHKMASCAGCTKPSARSLASGQPRRSATTRACCTSVQTKVAYTPSTGPMDPWRGVIRSRARSTTRPR